MSSSKDLKIQSGAVVCLESKLKGNITVGSMTVIHPKATIIAEAGPILIGKNNIIEEQSLIIHRFSDGVQKENPVPLSIGINNVFEVGCEIHAKAIGDHNVFEPKCYVGPDVEVGNGCIIGAGCRVTVAEKLPDQTVITGLRCTRGVGLDRPPDPDDLERQQDELTVMSEIFTNEEFKYNSVEAGVFTVFDALISLPRSLILSISRDSVKTEFPISYLPPIHLVAFLGQGYPSLCPPEFTVSCSWLSQQKLKLIVEKLLQLWHESKSEILYNWCSFLKDQSIELLSLQTHHDLSEKYSILFGKHNQELDQHNKDIKYNERSSSFRNCASSSKTGVSNNKHNESDYGKRKYVQLNESKIEEKTVYDKKVNRELDFLRNKAISKAKKESQDRLKTYHKQNMNELYFNLIEYNALKCAEEFKRNMQECNVCFCQVQGDQCKQLACSHISCTECLTRMCEVHIKHGTVEELVCPQDNCNFEIPVNLIQELVTRELFDKFDKLMLNKTLDKISNMNYCPLVHCQYPVAVQEEESLAVCPSCNHAFCVYCRRAYHGVEGCSLKSGEKLALLELYQNSDYNKRLELEKRYGKKQLLQLVNAAKTDEWMSMNCKRCPCCNISIEKNDGCNKMICKKCNTNFCWICLARVSSLNPYLHFHDPKSKCFNLLFEGTYHENYEDEDNDIFDEEDEYLEEYYGADLKENDNEVVVFE